MDLSLSLIASPLTRPVLDGKVGVEGATVKAQAARSVNTNSMEMLDLKYDVAEMSLATFTKAREMGIPLVALPIFPGRRFMQGGVVVNVSSNIHDLDELRGRTVGLPQFWMTSSVWHRLVLNQAYGVPQHEVNWVTTAPERMGTLGLPPEARQDTSGRSARELLQAGEVDAVMGPGLGEGGRGEGEPSSSAGLRTPFADPNGAQRAYYEKTGIFPIVHLIVMKEALARQDPELVESLCNSFQQAKQIGLPEMLENPATRPLSGLDQRETQSLFGEDPWPYGVAANRKVLELFLGDVRQQGLIDRDMAVDELFASDLPAGVR
jgi:4,5-dihydroxyphthalate decarboxylase